MNTKTATRLTVNRGRDFSGDARLYRLSEPLEGHTHVIVSAVASVYVTETYIFPADESGEVTDWGELPGSFRGDTDHEQALNNAGYDVTE